jgi:hypothetical protein
VKDAKLFKASIFPPLLLLLLGNLGEWETNMKCEICGYLWVPRVDNPKSCPSCKYRFDYADASLKRKKMLEALKETENEADA